MVLLKVDNTFDHNNNNNKVNQMFDRNPSSVKGKLRKVLSRSPTSSSQIAITCHQSYITLPNADSGNTMFRTFLLPISVQHICRPIAVTF